MWAVTVKAAIPPLIYRSEDARRPAGICADAIKTFLLVPLPKHSPALGSGRRRRLNRVCSAALRAGLILAVAVQVSQTPVTSFL